MSRKNRDTYRKALIKQYLDTVIPKRRKKNKKEKINAKYSRASEAPMHIAFIIDGIVEDVIHCDERLGTLLLSEPLIIEIEKDSGITIDWMYNENTKKFYEISDINV